MNRVEPAAPAMFAALQQSMTHIRVRHFRPESRRSPVEIITNPDQAEETMPKVCHVRQHTLFFAPFPPRPRR